MEKSIDIMLANTNKGFEDKIIKTLGVIDQADVNLLNNLVDESIGYDKQFKRINDKKNQAIRHAQRLMRRIIASHGVKYDEETQAVGVSKGDLIYVGDKDRVSANPDAEPLEVDLVKAKITKAERRKYNELIDGFKWINEKIAKHNQNVEDNENKLIAFEKSVLNGVDYDKEKQSLLVLTNGVVYICNK